MAYSQDSIQDDQDPRVAKHSTPKLPSGSPHLTE